MARRIGMAAVVVPVMVAGWVAVGTVWAGPEAVEVAPGVEVQDATTSQMDAARWAARRLDHAGLELPAVRITFHQERSSCRDNPGAGTLIEGAYLVGVCVGPGDPEVLVRWTLLHELAHAWGHGLTDERREDFLTARGLSSWNDRALPWAERGTEHAAEIVTWALMDRPVALTRLPDNDCPSLEVAYEVLTRSDLPEDHPGCPSWVRAERGGE